MRSVFSRVLALLLVACSGPKADIEAELRTLDLTRGDIALCGAGEGQFGSVNFGLTCSPRVQADFNLATALLHSFEYTESEKAYAKVIDADPTCVMAYWGAAMSLYHPLWAPPDHHELEKGAKVIALGRSIVGGADSKESRYLEAIATIFDDWDKLNHLTRVLKFEAASKKVADRYPDDHEAAVFYALAIRAAADPTDKTFARQKKAAEILNGVLEKEPNHPGITHYIIHTYDYPELAELALPAARSYAQIAAASAHAQHMPSHIFTRLGLWSESAASNIKSIAAAQCYAQQMGVDHYDEELHGMDYLTYAYLQSAADDKALEQLQILDTITEVWPQNFKNAFAFASIPARYALERKDWEQASRLQLAPTSFPWNDYPWERSNLVFGRLLGNVHLKKLADARKDLELLKSAQQELATANNERKSRYVLIQAKAGEAWILFTEGEKPEAFALMTKAADLEDGTEKEAVTPGEVLPARELLGDMHLADGDYSKALEAYEANLVRRPNRYNSLYGAFGAARKLGKTTEAREYQEKLREVTKGSVNTRAELVSLKTPAL